MRAAGAPAALVLVLVLALGPVVVGCGATEGARSSAERDGGMRPLAELPADYAELWRAYLARGEDWPARRRAALADPKLARFLIENVAVELVTSYASGDVSTGRGGGGGRYARARAELITIGPPAVPTLAELAAIGNGTAAFVCGEALIAIGAPSTLYVAGLLDRDEPRARERAALILAELPHADADEDAVRTALDRRVADDPEWTVRVACVRAIAARGGRDATVGPALHSLTAALGDESADVSSEAATGLGELGDPAAVPALINHLERCDRSADALGYRAALASLRALTGQRSLRRPEEWRAWWRTRR